MSPPTWVLGPRSSDEAATGRRAAKAQRKAADARDLLVQCGRCGVKGTARTDGHRVLSTTVAGSKNRHAGCGGRLSMFDLAGSR